ncbi:MAG: hypothetical protein AB1601_01305 [Planctomycetota bacterium]
MRTVMVWSGLAWLLATAVTPALGQTAPLQLRTINVKVESGIVQNDGATPAVVFSEEITVPDATWVQLRFDTAKLAGEVGSGQESYLVITSMLDGAFQYLNHEHVRQWQYQSAYFNGNSVLVELVAFPGTGPNQLSISQVVTGESAGEDSICGPTDDRVLSYDKRAGRLQPGGCTAWMIDDCTHCFLTAGHCSSGNNIVEFNVPLSSPSGSLNHPGPEDQYAIDPASMQSNGGQGVGNDYAYFGCFPNSVTGKTPVQAQGEWYILTLPPPVQGQNIRITGYGTVSSPVSPTWNQVQKTHVGPYATFTGTTVQYRTDTTGGNSGSPVIWEEENKAIGIHTHGGCTSSGGQNSGTGLNLPALQAVLASPKGVCVCPPGMTVNPGGDLVSQGDPGGPFDPVSKDYTIENHKSVGINYEVTKTQPWVSLTNATGYLNPGGSAVVTVSINAQANTLPLGLYTDTIQFTNLTSHEGDTTRKVTLKVGGPKKVYGWDLSTDPGWTISGGAWAYGKPTGAGGAYGGPDPTSGYTGQSVYGYNLNGDYTNNMPEYHLTTAAIDCSNVTQTSLRFWRWLGVERSSYDHAYVRLSTNGTTWTNVWANPDSETADVAWVAQEFDISALADNQPTVYLRWTMGTTDSGWTYCGWNIDDIEIWGVQPQPYRPGDMNCDGNVDFGDINPFVLALTNPAAYVAQFPNCNIMLGDINNDGRVDFGDINPFVNLLTNP